jgi:hypothetical protein
MRDLNTDNLDNLTVAEFEAYLPELFAAGKGKITENPRFANFLAANPDCAALVTDLETIAEHARSLFAPEGEESEGGLEPSDNVWSNIASKLKDEPKDEN